MSTICCARKMPKIEGYFACLLHIKLQNDDFQYHFLIIIFFVYYCFNVECITPTS